MPRRSLLALFAVVAVAHASTVEAMPMPVCYAESFGPFEPANYEVFAPLDGVVAIPWFGPNSVSGVTCTVSSATEADVPGTIAVEPITDANWAEGQLLVWRAAAPLQPETLYSLDCSSSNEPNLGTFCENGPPPYTTFSFTFRTVGVEQEPPALDVDLAIFVHHTWIPTRECCPGTQVCVETAYAPGPIRLDWSVEPQLPVPVWYTLTVESPGMASYGFFPSADASGSFSRSGGQDHTQPVDSYCARLRIDDLRDGSVSVGPWQCVEAANVLPAPEVEPGVFDPALCESESEREDADADGGCSIGGANSADPPAWLAFAALFGLLRLRRRR